MWGGGDRVGHEDRGRGDTGTWGVQGHGAHRRSKGTQGAQGHVHEDTGCTGTWGQRDMGTEEHRVHGDMGTRAQGCRDVEGHRDMGTPRRDMCHPRIHGAPRCHSGAWVPPRHPRPLPRPVSCVLPQVVYKNNDFKLELSRLAQEGDARVSLHGDLLFGCRPVPAPEPVTFGSPRAFLALPPPWRAARAGSVSFDFRTTEPNGLLLLGRGRPGGPRPGYLALELLDGHLYLLLDMGGGGGGLRLRASARKVTDGEWCHVDVQRDGRRGERGRPRGARGR